ncbi:unnamed protein product [Cuscuta campestris]|uniref:SOSEKI DIX-like domain-containing protein n=1 Tax=Cuscuta campestris TaxID=132261 RepID=A0A484NLJ6_9ASTE|nr:unnamed protein product [Cuscuta campestris]
MEVHRGGGAAAEVCRKLHIIYFLSRKARTEHPHLFSVHTYCRHGVRLRDVKGWLGELRGKEFPESFAWSYKRLRDSNPKDQCQCHKETSMDHNLSGKTSPETSTFAGEDGGASADKIQGQEMTRRSTGGERSASSSLCSLFSKHKIGGEDDGAPQPSASIFRNLITCGTVDTKDSAVLRRHPPPAPLPEKKDCSEICCKKTERLRGSQRIFSSNGNKEHRHSKPMKGCEELYGRRPFNKSPHCSQCGKPFNPEKLHSHMKSCKILRNYKEKEYSKRSTEGSLTKNSYCFTH